MGYLNKPDQVPDPPTNPIKRFLYNIKIEAILIRLGVKREFVRLKLLLIKRGLNIGISFADMIAGGLTEIPEYKRDWDDEGPPSEEEVLQCVEGEIIPWIHEQVTRSPVPFGTDISVVIIGVFYGDRQYHNHIRYVDKYGWRKYASRETETWLKENMLRHREDDLDVGIIILSFGKMILTYEKALNQAQ